MATLSFIFGIIGNVISLLVFASPIKTFWRVVKMKSTENFKGLPYICTLLSTSLWTFYGLLKPGGFLIVTVNSAGATLQFIYVVLFLCYAPKKIKVKSMKLVAIMDIGFLGLVIAITLLALHGKIRLTVVGVLCAGLTLGMYASPLAAMATVIRTKSVEYMPFSLSFFLFLNGGVWSVYAVLVKDYYIGVPNGMGFLLGTAQLVVYIVYRNKSASAKPAEKMREEGSVDLVKGGIEMREYDDGEAKRKTRTLTKGTSLPEPPVSRQLSFQKLFKSYSLTLYEVNTYKRNPSLPLDEEVGNGDPNNHGG